MPTLSGSESGNSGISYRQNVQPLMSASEVRRFFARSDRYNRQLVLIPGELPYIMSRANFDQHPLFAGRYTERE